MTYGKVNYTKLEFSNFYKQKSREHRWEYIWRVWENGGRNKKLDQAKFIDMGTLSKGFAFNAVAWGVRRGSYSLSGWTKRWPTVNELEMPDLSWFNVEEGSRSLGRC